MSIRRLTLAVLASLCALGGGVLSSAAPARAVVAHPYLSQLTGFSDPVAVTVDSSSDVYVADSGARVVDRLDSSGVPLAFSASEPYVEGAKLKGAPTGPGGAVVLFEDPQGVAVDDATGDVYVADGGLDVVDVFSSTGEYLSQLTGTPPSAPVSGAFQDPAGLAVDEVTHELYVTDPHSGVVDVFSASGEYRSQFGDGVLGGHYGESVAVNDLTEDAYVGDSGFDTVPVFDALGSFLPPAWTGASTPSGSFGHQYVYLGLDQRTGHVYVADTEHNVVDELGSSATEEYERQLTGTPSGAFDRPQAVAVDPVNGDVYVANVNGVVDVFGPAGLLPDVSTGEASGLEAEGSAALNGTVDPDGVPVTSCEFEYGTEASYGKTAACESSPGSGTEPVAVRAKLTGLLLTPGTIYHYRLFAGNANGSNFGVDRTFITPGPTVVGESVADVASSSATLQAQVNPGGVETTYRFEYGPSVSYGESVPVPEGDAGSGTGGVEVSAHPQDLKPDTVYHFRVVVSNAVQREVVGPDQQFTTQPAGTELVLPDNREWELVSPPSKYGAGLLPINPLSGALIQAAENGGAMAYDTAEPIEPNPPANRAPEDTQVLSVRNPGGGWATQDILLPKDESGSVDLGWSEYEYFSSDLSVGLSKRPSQKALPPLPEGSQRTPYLRKNFGVVEYEPLLPTANTLSGAEYGKSGLFGVFPAGVSPDLGHVVLESQSVPLIAGAVDGSLYEWSQGAPLKLVSVLPASEGGGATAGNLGVVGDSSSEPEPGIRHAVSNDGSRIVWNTSGSSHLHLYLRDMVKGETVRVSPGGGEFQAASSDGSRVFFTEEGELYVFEVTSHSGEALAGKLTDLTVDANAGERAAILGEVLGASEDGAYVYFVTNGVIGDGAARGAKTGTCETEGSYLRAVCNVYVDHFNGTEWTGPHYIATLADQDGHDWSGGTHTSRVSPNGRYLAFMSERSLTGYDNRDANSGELDEELYLYDSESGRLVCASCDPSGARPVGVLDPGRNGGVARPGEVQKGGLLVDFGGTWASRWLAALIPGWTEIGQDTPGYLSRSLSDNGRLFFDSIDPLVAADVSGSENVFEYEPEGVGSCQSTTAQAGEVFSEAADGCVGLISSGISAEESAFLDASEDGGEVFFMTSARLVPQDYDNAYDVYDARVCTSESPCLALPAAVPPPCDTGDACKPAPTPQPTIFGAPSSETFSGAGNISPSPPAAPARKTTKKKAARCPRGKRRSHGRCVKGKRKTGKSSRYSKKGRK